MAKCNTCVHFDVCEKHNATVDFDVDNGVCLHYEKQVARCKDCAKISPSVTPIKDAVWCREFRAYMPCNGFCSYGERKEGAD